MKNSTLNLLAAGIVSAGIAMFTPGCCSTDCGGSCAKAPASCGCAKAPAACACATPCSCADCGCAYGNWGLTLPYPEMNAGHLILEKGKDGKPTALLLWRWGSPTPADVTQIDATSFTIRRAFSKPKGKENDKAAWRALSLTCKVDGKALKGTFCTVDGNGKAVDKPQDICGKRNPPVGPAPDFTKAVYGQPINLLAGTINDFEIMGKDKINGWTLKDGMLSNRITRDKNGKSVHKNGNLRTKRADFFDFNLKYEVRVLPGCNSGVYLRGIYEIQVLDSYGKPVDMHHMAAYYGRVTPKVAAEKPERVADRQRDALQAPPHGGSQRRDDHRQGTRGGHYRRRDDGRRVRARSALHPGRPLRRGLPQHGLDAHRQVTVRTRARTNSTDHPRWRPTRSRTRGWSWTPVRARA